MFPCKFFLIVLTVQTEVDILQSDTDQLPLGATWVTTIPAIVGLLW